MNEEELEEYESPYCDVCGNYYKYNNRYLKSEIKEDINKLLEEIE